MNKNTYYLLSVSIIILAIISRLLWAYFTPSYQAPDEYPHFYVIKKLTLSDEYPLSKPYFPYYEAFQPPLYYILSSNLIYSFVKRFDNSSDNIERVLEEGKIKKNYALIFLRIFSVLISSISIIIVYKLICFYAKERTLFVLFSLSFYCFLPTFVNNGSTVNNDVLANLIGLIILFITIAMPLSYRKIIFLSISCGLGILTKYNILPLILIPLLDLFSGDVKVKNKLLYITLFFLLIVVICSPYLLWNLHRYNTFFPLNPGVSTIFSLNNIKISTLSRALRNFNWSFWAAAGRIYEIHFPPFVYIFFYLPFTFISLLGIIKIFFNISRKVKIVEIFNDKENKIKIILLMSIILEIATSLNYTLSYTIFCSWGKYVYPVLPAIAILFTEGICATLRGGVLYIMSSIFIAGLLISNMWLFFKAVG